MIKNLKCDHFDEQTFLDIKDIYLGPKFNTTNEIIRKIFDLRHLLTLLDTQNSLFNILFQIKSY